ncbi:MAG: ROK family protein, partial [Lachnospiraceae bacterium]|nr:ROK family protein [Lachnospiraceae bacterium]
MKKYCFGIDVGGTSVKMGFFRTDGELLEKWEIPTRTESGGSAILPDIAASALAKLDANGIDKSEVVGMGIGIPGPINAAGVVPHTANLGWGYKEVTRELTELTGIPSKGGNDANVAALGEMWKGAAAGHQSGVMVTLGTGVGGGIIVEGQIRAGALGAGVVFGDIQFEAR